MGICGPSQGIRVKITGVSRRGNRQMRSRRIFRRVRRIYVGLFDSQTGTFSAAPGAVVAQRKIPQYRFYVEFSGKSCASHAGWRICAKRQERPESVGILYQAIDATQLMVRVLFLRILIC